MEDEPPLVLSTIHSAKGLEFDTVFVIQVLEGILPSAYSLRDDEALDEELRLLYVAITRAEQNLFVSYPMVQRRRMDGDYFARPSRYISDVSESILEPIRLEEARSRDSEGELRPHGDLVKKLPAKEADPKDNVANLPF